MIDDQLEQGIEIARARVLVGARIAVAARGPERGEVELLVIGVEAEEELETFVEHLVGARVGTIDLVDDDDRLEAQRQRLAGHELGLRHRPLGGIDEQDHPVDHAEDTLHLGAEIGVAGGVDDVDARRLALMLPFHAGAFGEDGDPAFLFEIARIHRALFHALVFAEGAGLAEQLVDQRGLAVVDVGDNGDIAQVAGHGRGAFVRIGKRGNGRANTLCARPLAHLLHCGKHTESFAPARSRSGRCGGGATRREARRNGGIALVPGGCATYGAGGAGAVSPRASERKAVPTISL